MAEKKGAGGKPQTYDESTGRYGNGSGNKSVRNSTSQSEKIKSAIRR